jgi:hypothetical protein
VERGSVYADICRPGRGRARRIKESAPPGLPVIRSAESPSCPRPRDGFAYRLNQHAMAAAQKQPSLASKTVTPYQCSLPLNWPRSFSLSICAKRIPRYIPANELARLMVTIACGGLRSTPDCRTRRTFLHLPHSCASPCGPNDARDTRPTLPTWARSARSQVSRTRASPTRGERKTERGPPYRDATDHSF